MQYQQKSKVNYTRWAGDRRGRPLHAPASQRTALNRFSTLQWNKLQFFVFIFLSETSFLDEVIALLAGQLR